MRFTVLIAITWTFTILVSCCRNPVPNPGMTEQKRIPDYFVQYSHEGEGYHGPTAMVEADSWIHAYCNTTANGGQQPPMSISSNGPTRPYTVVHKRSYRRACKRALQHGTAQYHGHPMTVRDFPPSLVRKLQQEMLPQGGQSRPQRQALKTVDRLTCLHWNPGGLSQSALLEIKHWLRDNKADVVVLTETKWSFSSNWHDKDWMFVQTATSDYKSGGILIMVSRRIAEPEQLGYANIIDGRLLHVRIHYATRALDLVATYQYVAAKTPIAMKQRLTVWTALHELLHKMPSRNNLLCVGDFNCGLAAQSPWVGTSTFKWEGKPTTGPRYVDQDQFLDLLKAHGLTAINTWGASGPSFVHGPIASRIDHFLIRITACDGLAKRSISCHQRPLFHTTVHTIFL